MNRISFFCLFFGVCLSASSFATTIREREYTCSACHNTANHYVLGSTNQLRSGSLDGRPGEMARSAFIGTIQQCKKCGLVSYDISKEICPRQNEIIKSQDYKSILEAKNVNELSQKYLAYAYLLEGCQKDKKEIANAYVNAAWAADDEGETENAINFRKKAISYMKEEANIESQIRLIDLYRRAALFTEALELCNQITVDPKSDKACLFNGLIEHQKELIADKNTEDQRMFYSLYCPPTGNDRQMIDSYMDLIELLEENHQDKKAHEIRLKVIPYLEGKQQFINKFVLTYLYYQTNQIQKAKALEKELVIPQKWDGYFSKRYGNHILWQIKDNISKNKEADTEFIKLTKEMLKIREQKEKNLGTQTDRERIIGEYSSRIIEHGFNDVREGSGVLQALFTGKVPCDIKIKKGEKEKTSILTFPTECKTFINPEDKVFKITIDEIIKAIQKYKGIKLTCSSENVCVLEDDDDF